MLTNAKHQAPALQSNSWINYCCWWNNSMERL
jgi:hypothetical protein